MQEAGNAKCKALEAQIAANDKLYSERFESGLRQRLEAIESMRARVDANDQRALDHTQAVAEQRKQAEFSLEKRLDGMNEFRMAMSDQSANMLPRREFEQVRDQILARVDQVRPGLAERVAANAEAIAVMIPRREFDEARSVIMDRVENLRVTQDAQLTSYFEPLRVKVEAQSQPNWALLASCMSILMVIIAGAWMVMGLKIDGATSPIVLSLEQSKVAQAGIAERVRIIDANSQASSQADQASRADRLQINERMRIIEGTQQARTQSIADVSNLKQQYTMIVDRLQTIRAENTKQSAALIEIETQFCAADIMRNMAHAHDMRITSMLWAKTFDQGIKLPTDNAYYPVICNRPTGTGGTPGTQ